LEIIIASLTLNQLNDPPSLTLASTLMDLPEDSDISETEWLHAAAANPAFDFLKDPEEDIYMLSDGRPFYDER
jgi:hypothetical protein